MTSLDRSIRAEPRPWPTAVWAAAAFWVAAGGSAAVASIRAASDSGRAVLVVAAFVSVVAFVAGAVIGRRTGHAAWFGAGLVISGLAAPTTFAYPLDAVPIVAGIALVVWERRSRPIRDL